MIEMQHTLVFERKAVTPRTPAPPAPPPLFRLVGYGHWAVVPLTCISRIPHDVWRCNLHGCLRTLQDIDIYVIIIKSEI